MNISINKISILDSGCDAVVNAANSSLMQGGGVCGAIFKAAGSTRLQEACDKIGGCRTGGAVITPGFKLSKYIIHAVGPIYDDGTHNENVLLESCYKNTMNLVYENKCESVCFPLISAGIYGYPNKEAFTIALKAISDWGNEHNNPNIRVVFAIPEGRKLSIGFKCAEQLGIFLGEQL